MNVTGPYREQKARANMCPNGMLLLITGRTFHLEYYLIQINTTISWALLQIYKLSLYANSGIKLNYLKWMKQKSIEESNHRRLDTIMKQFNRSTITLCQKPI